MTFGVGVVIGIFVGATLTMIVMACCIVAGEADMEMENIKEQQSERQEQGAKCYGDKFQKERQ